MTSRLPRQPDQIYTEVMDLVDETQIALGGIPEESPRPGRSFGEYIGGSPFENLPYIVRQIKHNAKTGQEEVTLRAHGGPRQGDGTYEMGDARFVFLDGSLVDAFARRSHLPEGEEREGNAGSTDRELALEMFRNLAKRVAAENRPVTPTKYQVDK